MATAYEQGFLNKCAELGVDPAVLVKQAGVGEFAAKHLPTFTAAGKAVGKAVGKAGDKARATAKEVGTQAGARLDRFSNSAKNVVDRAKLKINPGKGVGGKIDDAVTKATMAAREAKNMASRTWYGMKPGTRKAVKYTGVGAGGVGVGVAGTKAMEKDSSMRDQDFIDAGFIARCEEYGVDPVAVKQATMVGRVAGRAVEKAKSGAKAVGRFVSEGKALERAREVANGERAAGKRAVRTMQNNADSFALKTFPGQTVGEKLKDVGLKGKIGIRKGQNAASEKWYGLKPGTRTLVKDTALAGAAAAGIKGVSKAMEKDSEDLALIVAGCRAMGADPDIVKTAGLAALEKQAQLIGKLTDYATRNSGKFLGRNLGRGLNFGRGLKGGFRHEIGELGDAAGHLQKQIRNKVLGGGSLVGDTVDTATRIGRGMQRDARLDALLSSGSRATRAGARVGRVIPVSTITAAGGLTGLGIKAVVNRDRD